MGDSALVTYLNHKNCNISIRSQNHRVNFCVLEIRALPCLTYSFSGRSLATTLIKKKINNDTYLENLTNRFNVFYIFKTYIKFHINRMLFTI